MDANKIGRLYKGEEYDIDIKIPYSGQTFSSFELKFFTDSASTFNVPFNQLRAEGNIIHVNIQENDFDVLSDGVLRYYIDYIVNDVETILSTNTMHYLKTPEGYSGKTAEDIYNEGYHDGIEDAGGDYTEGYNAGIDYQKSKLISIEITDNGTFVNADGYSAVTVDVPQQTFVGQEKNYNIIENCEITIRPDLGFDGITGGTITVNTPGHSDAEMEESFESGYTEGYGEGYESGETHGYDIGYETGYTEGYSSGTTDGYNEGYPEGYESGATDGYNTGYDAGYPDGYTSGTTDGFESGFTEGYASGNTDGYNTGYETGYTEGFASGETHGYNEGYTSGNTDGYNTGYASGETDGYNEGYETGYTQGYTSGETDGYNEGYTDGYASGDTQGYESGYTEGYSEGYTSGNTDGYNTGYASGETDGMAEQKALLVSSAFTENGTYTRENGWNEVTVDVPTTEVSEYTKKYSISANGTSDFGTTIDFNYDYSECYDCYSGYSGLYFEYTISGSTPSGTYDLGVMKCRYRPLGVLPFRDVSALTITMKDGVLVYTQTPIGNQMLFTVSGYGTTQLCGVQRFFPQEGSIEFVPNSAITFGNHILSAVTVDVDVPTVISGMNKTYSVSGNGNYNFDTSLNPTVSIIGTRKSCTITTNGELPDELNYLYDIYAEDDDETDYSSYIEIYSLNGNIHGDDAEWNSSKYGSVNIGEFGTYVVVDFDFEEKDYDWFAEESDSPLLKGRELVLDNVKVNVDVQPNVISTFITHNGRYDAQIDDGVDGYNIVNVDIRPHVIEKRITQNGTYYAQSDDSVDGYDIVNVAVQPNLGSLNADQNNHLYIASLDGYDGYNYVNVEVDVSQELTNLFVQQNGTYNIMDDPQYPNFKGYDMVHVDVRPNLQSKNFTISANGQTQISVDSGYDGITGGTINVNVPQSGHTDEELEEAYESGYTEGYTSGTTDGFSNGYTSGSTDGYNTGYSNGYDAGYQAGITYQKSLLSSTTITQDGTYTSENGWNVVIVNTTTPTYPDMLHFTAQQANSSVGLNIPSGLNLTLYKSTDGVNFSSWDGTAVALSNIGDTLWVYGTNNKTAIDGNSYSNFTMSGQIAAAGDVTYLLQNGGTTTLTSSHAFFGLFRNCTALTTAPELPATTLTDYCYCLMFCGTSITTAPTLNATTLASDCYSYMFSHCTSLVNVQASLPATTIPSDAYRHMFEHCYSLTTAPNLPATNVGLRGYIYMFEACINLVNVQQSLPATTLGQEAYEGMFRYCQSLVNAPALPCTTLSSNCYNSMFRDCISLVNAPALPASTIATAAYTFMFLGCTSLQSINVSATSWDTQYTSSWVEYVPSGGTFTKLSGTTIPTGDNGIPNGWTVVNV